MLFLVVVCKIPDFVSSNAKSSKKNVTVDSKCCRKVQLIQLIQMNSFSVRVERLAKRCRKII